MLCGSTRWRGEISEEGNPTEVTMAENDCRYYLTLGTLWPDIRATHCFTARSQQNTAKDYFPMKCNRRISSSVGIDVIDSSRVARSEHLLELLF